MTCEHEGVTDLLERVRIERQLKGWSMRDAASAGGISNQAWSVFERGGPITRGVHQAVMQAFGWPETWQTNPPPLPIGEPGAVELLQREIEGLRDQVRDLAEVTAQVLAELQRRDAAGGNPKPATQPGRRASAR